MIPGCLMREISKLTPYGNASNMSCRGSPGHSAYFSKAESMPYSENSLSQPGVVP